MSVSLTVTGVLQEPVCKLLTAAKADMLSVDAGEMYTLTVVGAVLVNVNNAPVVATVYYNDGTTDWPIFRRSIPADDTVTVALDLPVRLFGKQVTRKIVAEASIASKVTLTLSTTMATQMQNEPGR